MWFSPSAASTGDKAMISSIRQLTNRAKTISRREGRLALLRQGLLFARQAVASYSVGNIFQSDLDPPEMECHIKDLTVNMISTLEELAPLEKDPSVGNGFDMPRNRQLIEMGSVLFCTFAGGELAHVTQVLIGEEAHHSYPFSFAMPPGDTVGLAGYTAPRYRRQGIHLYTRVRALRYLKKQGLRHAWDVQNKDNAAARRAVLKLGYYLRGEGCRLRALSRFTLEWTRSSRWGIPRRVRLSLR